LKRGLNTHKRL